MKDITVNKVLELCNGKLLTSTNNTEIADFCKDTRELKAGDFYIAIKGDKTDGNIFVQKALENGAIGCLIDEDIDEKIIENYQDRVIIKVENTIKAIQEIAKYKRSLYNIPVIAVTGSVRKNEYKRCYCKCSFSKI